MRIGLQIRGTSALVWHGAGGPAPVVSSLVITSGAKVLYKSPRGKRFCVQLKQRELESIQQLIAPQDLQQSAIEAQREGEGYFDYENIEIQVRSWSAQIPLELVPPDVREVLLRLNAILRRHLGKLAPWMDSLDESTAPINAVWLSVVGGHR